MQGSCVTTFYTTKWKLMQLCNHVVLHHYNLTTLHTREMFYQCLFVPLCHQSAQLLWLNIHGLNFTHAYHELNL